MKGSIDGESKRQNRDHYGRWYRHRQGNGPGYPAYSPNVVAVGGTSLYLHSNNTYSMESAWSDSGGGISSYEREPAYQDSVQSTGKRTVPDVSFDADPNTGVAIYDSYDNPSGPWTEIGGTSLATPSWAGIVAIINQGRVAIGCTTLIGATQTLPGLYSLPSSAFHDVTEGTNGTYSAKPGYDLVTGIGTPVANILIPDMVAYADANVPHLVITSPPPASAQAGTQFGFNATVDVGTSTENSFSGAVTVSLLNNPGGSTLGGSTFTVSVSNGRRLDFGDNHTDCSDRQGLRSVVHLVMADQRLRKTRIALSDDRRSLVTNPPALHGVIGTSALALRRRGIPDIAVFSLAGARGA